MSSLSEVKQYTMDDLKVFDFNEFFRSKRLRPEDFLACKIKELVGQVLPSFLIEMDLEEYKILKEEDAFLKKGLKKHRRTCTISLGISGAILFAQIGGYFSSPDKPSEANLSVTLISALVGALGLGSLGYPLGSFLLDREEEGIVVCRDRINRLDTKISRIEQRLLDRRNQDEYTQLVIVKPRFTVVKEEMEGNIPSRFIYVALIIFALILSRMFEKK